MNIDQKRIVITGASSGIGRALLAELLIRQVQVVPVGRDETRLQEALRSVEAPRAKVMPFACDVALQRDVDDLFDYAIQHMGGIDIFFANAGIAYWEWIQQPEQSLFPDSRRRPCPVAFPVARDRSPSHASGDRKRPGDDLYFLAPAANAIGQPSFALHPSMVPGDRLKGLSPALGDYKETEK